MNKKYLLALTLMAPMASYALSVDVENDLTVRSGDTSVLVDQDKNKLQVKYGSLSLYKSDDVQLGTELDVIDFSGLTGSIHYEYTEDNDSVVGLSTGFSFVGINLDTKLDWNVNETEFDAELGTGYAIAGLDGDVTTYWDVDDFDYNGLDLSLGYTLPLSDRFSIRPNVTVPFDDDFSRGDYSAGISIVIALDTHSEHHTEHHKNRAD